MKWIWKSQSQKEERTMTYNTRIYNYANLHSKDKQIVQAQLLMLESVEDTITNYTYAKETSTNILESIGLSSVCLNLNLSLKKYRTIGNCIIINTAKTSTV